MQPITHFFVVVTVALVFSQSVRGQGQLRFDNRVTGTTTTAVVAPIYGLEPDSPFLRKFGNAATGPTTPIPTGTQTYFGTPLLGSGYTASLWTRQAGSTNNFVMMAETPFRTTTVASAAGFWQIPPTAVVVTNVPSDPVIRAECFVRVWDNRNGTISNWNQVNLPENADVPRGYSETFVVPERLGGGTFLPATLVGLQSFCLTRADTVHGTITLQSEGPGILTKTPDHSEYVMGEPVVLQASPARWHSFAGWSDGATNNPRTISVLPGANVYTAVFSPTTAVETLVFNGTTRIAPVGMPAIFVDGEFITSNTVERLNAATISISTSFTNGFIFYTLDDSTPSLFSQFYTAPFQLKRTRRIRALAYDSQLIARWETDPVLLEIVPTYPVSALSQGGGSVVLSPALSAFRSNTLVNVTASPLPGWTFLQWLGDVRGTNPSVNLLVVDRPLCLEAVFGTAIQTTVPDGGAIFRDPDLSLLPYGTTLRLTGVPAAGGQFVRWGAGLGSNNPVQFQVTTVTPPVTAQFSEVIAGTHTLVVRILGDGGGLQSPRGNAFADGQSILLVAQPDSGMDFLGWSGDTTATQQTLSITLSRDRMVTASFGHRLKLDLWSCGGSVPRDPLRAILSSKPGDVLSIDASDDLEHWTPMLTTTNVFGRLQMDIPTPGSNRFYRASSPR